ncbi:MAG: hypothetical protein JW860_01585 [Sedimentisphaerales bacterium]|nr:hypothetical protein [Sedimentisphaerales bacterium]
MNKIKTRKLKHIRIRMVVLTVFVGLTVLFSPVRAAREIFEDVAVSLLPIEQFRQSTHGYLEYRFEIENLSPEKNHSMELIFPAGDSGSGDRVQEMTRRIELSPSSRIQVSLWQPPVPISWGDFAQLNIEGVGKFKFPMSRYNHGFEYHNPDIRECILISRSIGGEFVTEADKIFGGEGGDRRPQMRRSNPLMPMIGIGGEYEIKRAEVPIDQWSSHWLGYSRYDTVVVTAEDMLSMPAGIRTALLRYTECGGSLVVAGPWQGPQEWQGYKESISGGWIYYCGFGQCLVLAAPEMNQWSEALWQQIKDGSESSKRPWLYVKTVVQANEQFSVVESLAVPVRGLFVLIMLFAVVIGPLNLLFFSRRGRRIRLLWTVPLLSLLTSAAVFAYAIAAEGLSGHTRIEGLTILDEKAHRATSIGWLGYYSPLTPGSGLIFDNDSEITPQIISDSYSPFRGDKGRGRVIDWTSRQHFIAGWVTARVPAHFMIRKSQSRRERITVRETQEGNVNIVNGLGVDIKQLWLADREGRIHQAGDIAAGASCDLSLMPVNVRAGGSLYSLRKLYAQDWVGTVDRVTKSPESYLRPECYLAVVEKSPFIEPGLADADLEQSQSVVYGIME